MQRPITGTHSSVAAMIRDELIDAVGPGRRSKREAVFVAFLGGSALVTFVLAFILALRP